MGHSVPPAPPSLPLWLLFLAMSTWRTPSVSGYLNIFISHHEVMKLMGLEADLFYVHEGAINTYAMHFTVPVPADIHELEFSWQSLIAYPLPYSISIEYNTDQEALGTPTLSIPHKGLVPQEIESFLVYLPCTGNATLQLPVNVNMVVRGPPRFNDTRLHFKRNKICAKGISPEPNQSPAPAHAPSQGPALLSAAACALGLVLAVGLVASMMYVKARKQLRQDSLHTSFTTAAYGSHQNVFIRLDPLGRPPSATGSYATIASLNKYPSESKKSCSIFDRFRSSPTPTPYATALLPMNHDQAAETIYSKPESICPSRISYYASSQLTQVTIPSNTHYPQSQGGVPDGRGFRGMRLGSTFESKPLIYWDTWQAQMEMEIGLAQRTFPPAKGCQPPFLDDKN
ncbi:tyrosine-protein kinase RYK [Drosophila ananassae]|nr:tyrosine-protein kinase RYK [Drosophila ananassae]